MTTSGKTSQLHIMLFPFMGHGHMIPAMDMAKLFASRGCQTTLILTHGNAPSFAGSVVRSRSLGLNIEIALVRFPAAEVGLPEGCENPLALSTPDMQEKFFAASLLLDKPLEKILQDSSPDCLIAGAFFPWATAVAAKFGIPRLVFYGTNFFSSSASKSLMEYDPLKNLSPDSDSFVIPNLPHEITLTRDQVPPYLTEGSSWFSFVKEVNETELTSYGVIVNSFYELEPDYADHFRTFLGRKAWHVGPLCLMNKNKDDKAMRGPEASIGKDECLNWLNSKEPKSVVYVSFGTVSNFPDEQLKEIAVGLEASGKQFIWVVKKEKREGASEEWLPEGFEERMEGTGLIIRGWASQVMILDHVAVGGFVTHCGWNSMLEGICAGIPMVTWPVSAEQFYNEKLATQILGIGVGVGAGKWARFVGDSVKSDAVAKAVGTIMAGEEAEEMRRKAEVLAEMARRAFEEGGSSNSDFDSLIDDLKLRRSAA